MPRPARMRNMLLVGAQWALIAVLFALGFCGSTHLMVLMRHGAADTDPLGLLLLNGIAYGLCRYCLLLVPLGFAFGTAMAYQKGPRSLLMLRPRFLKSLGLAFAFGIVYGIIFMSPFVFEKFSRSDGNM